MNQPQPADRPVAAPDKAVGKAIQDLTAARLGRGFLPLGVLAMVGIVQALRLPNSLSEGLILGLGAVAAGIAMLGYGLRISQLAFGRPKRAWMSLAMWGSLTPPVYALYVLGWRGLREFLAGGGVAGVATAIFFTAMGVWAMRSWMKVSEVQRLAKIMLMGLPSGSGE